MGNTSLTTAKRNKNDEFYTMYPDIEREMVAYWNFNKNVFRDKVVLCPADDPEWSNFRKFFADVFEEWGLKKLICTSYAPRSNQDALFAVDIVEERNDPKYDPKLSEERGRVLVLEREDLNDDGRIDRADMKWEYLEGDGDFRSAEVTALRDEADIVVTNPPFSLFREFLAWLEDGGVQYSIIGTINATTYKETFALIRENRLWKGATANSTDMIFRVPKGAEVKADDRAKAIRMLRKIGGQYADLPDDADFTRQGSSCWYTNIDHGVRHEWLELDTMERNQTKRNAKKKVREHGYLKYDNYDAIEVPFTDAIPCDYDGVMGVPTTFLDKYNPDQFEVIGTTESNDPENPCRTRWYSSEECRAAYLDRFGKPGSYDLNASGVVNGVKVFKRVLIRRLNGTEG
ncbi:adenine-specific methyltransferase EcoRI family protein [Corynebacterium marinum]|uniref:Adenine-specific DNA-methyltransferase n=1 Tax=Corynebacterium marinum DSM 44953 TaxID=1224162 RepID=A0A0B6TSL7_9CORY|nr:adenine-specific methyltransferase EcoRI family protein [Corynebacterium marinum]AJK68590.1 adenine-specific DNA-methyltransferase [Corynebacterium marinum DSM 44953]GGO14486.1 putative adenine-specific methylase [Corynebacterium marinum]